MIEVLPKVATYWVLTNFLSFYDGLERNVRTLTSNGQHRSKITFSNSRDDVPVSCFNACICTGS